MMEAQEHQNSSLSCSENKSVAGDPIATIAKMWPVGEIHLPTYADVSELVVKRA